MSNANCLFMIETCFMRAFCKELFGDVEIICCKQPEYLIYLNSFVINFYTSFLVVTNVIKDRP